MEYLAVASIVAFAVVAFIILKGRKPSAYTQQKFQELLASLKTPEEARFVWERVVMVEKNELATQVLKKWQMLSLEKVLRAQTLDEITEAYSSAPNNCFADKISLVIHEEIAARELAKAECDPAKLAHVARLAPHGGATERAAVLKIRRLGIVNL